jgi:UDP-arabinose 4-epimerase
MENILVTGGAGYIGSHACKALANAGYLPVVYDNLSRGHAHAVKWGPLERGDLLDRARLDEVMARHRPTAVVHFAALAYVGESVAEPLAYYRNNVAGSLTLVEAAQAAGIGAFVFSSTCAIYGSVSGAPIVEDTPVAPINPYGASKAMVERILRDAAAAGGPRAICLRYFNACGADPEGEIGEDHEPETHLIPRAAMAASGQIDALDIFGEDWPTPDGTCVRDYIHVADLADAHVAALRALRSGSAGGAYNLGVGRGFSVREIVDAMARVSGRKVPVRIGPRRAGDPATLTADASAARKALGWVPRIVEIDAIVDSAWRWHMRRHNR